jgi:hypothetical protein
MTLPKHALPKRRRQILDDQTQDASGQPDASGRQHSLHRDTLHQDTLNRDTWARNFVDRLAVLVRKIGGKNQA